MRRQLTQAPRGLRLRLLPRREYYLGRQGSSYQNVLGALSRQASGLSFRRLEGDDEAPLVGQELSRCTERESAERPSRTTCNTESSLEPAKLLQRTATNSCSELLGAGAATSTEASSQDVSLSFEPTSEPLALAHLREECRLMLKLRHPHVLCCSCWASSPVGVRCTYLL